MRAGKASEERARREQERGRESKRQEKTTRERERKWSSLTSSQSKETNSRTMSEQQKEGEIYYEEADTGPLGDWGAKEEKTGPPTKPSDPVGFCRYFLIDDHENWSAEDLLRNYPDLKIAGTLRHTSGGYGYMNCRNTLDEAHHKKWIRSIRPLKSIDLQL